MATVETDCSGLCWVTIKETSASIFSTVVLFKYISFNSTRITIPIFKNQSINPEEDNTHVV